MSKLIALLIKITYFITYKYHFVQTFQMYVLQNQVVSFCLISIVMLYFLWTGYFVFFPFVASRL